MDERFRGKGLWFGLGAVALIFLCLLLMAGAAVAVLAPFRASPAPVIVQPPAAGEGAVQPPAIYYGPGLLGGLGYGIRMLFKLAFLGLLLLLVFGLARRLFWGPRHWWAHYCAPMPSGEGREGQPGGGARPHAPWHWHGHGHHPWGPPPWWGPAPERAEGEGKTPGAPEAGQPATGYTGPQE